MKFTDRSIAALKPKRERYEVWDREGFGIRVTPKGVKSWVWLYRYQGRPRRMTLGRYPAVGLADARQKFAEAQKALGRGIDPGTVVVAERAAERAAETVSELVDDYLERWAKARKRSAGEDERLLRRDVLPTWGRRKAKDITRRDVIALLDRIMERGAPIAANRTLAVIRKMFNWAISRDLLKANPCAMVQAPGQEKRRDRVLSADEIAAFWHGLDKLEGTKDELGMSDAAKLALKLQLVTAQRKGEVTAAEWSEFDRVEKVWTIPAEKSKNGLPHRVPLSELALEVIDDIEALAKRNKRKGEEEAPQLPWLFPARNREGPITASSVNHALHRTRERLGIGDVVPHDLRRSAASHMASLGISRVVIGKLLNHAEPGVTAVYDRHSYDAEKRHALDAWSTRLKKILTGKAPDDNKVVPLQVAQA